jgi:serine/threonine protein kinase
VVDGLSYLHSHGIIHGDLKGSSVLVDDNGRACLTDFGLSAVFTDSGSGRSINDGRAVRWAAPEILNEQTPVSKSSDIYSLSMVIIEVFTGRVPFHGTAPATVAVSVLAGKRPTRPTDPDFTDHLWENTRCCWNQEPRYRPDISEVILCLQNDTVLQCGRTDTHDDQATDETAIESVREEDSLIRLCPQPSRWTSASSVLGRLCRFGRFPYISRLASDEVNAQHAGSEKPTGRGLVELSESPSPRECSWFPGNWPFIQSGDNRIRTANTIRDDSSISNRPDGSSVPSKMRRRV